MSLVEQLQAYKIYKNMNDKEIRKSIGKQYGIPRARNVELEIELDQLKSKSKKSKSKSKSKNLTGIEDPLLAVESSQFLPELSEEVLIRADLDTLRNYCIVNKQIHKLCESKAFWIKKMQYNNLPVPIFDEEKYKKNNKIKSEKLWYDVYHTLLTHQKIIKDILLINKIESRRKYNQSNGIIKIELYDFYEDGSADTLLSLFPEESFVFYLDDALFNTNKYGLNLLKFQLIDDYYMLIYTVLDLETENFLESKTKINELEVMKILGQIMFDAKDLMTDFDILDEHNNTFYQLNMNINPNSPLIGRESIWDTLKYLFKNKN